MREIIQHHAQVNTNDDIKMPDIPMIPSISTPMSMPPLLPPIPLQSIAPIPIFQPQTDLAASTDLDSVRRQIASQFKFVPAFLVTDVGDAKWAYLFDTVDFKVLMLLCTASRVFNRGFLTPAQHTMLLKTTRLRQMTDEEFTLCQAKSQKLDLVGRTVCDLMSMLLEQASQGSKAVEANFRRALAYECVVHLAASSNNDFKRKRLAIIGMSSHFGALAGLSAAEMGCVLRLRVRAAEAIIAVGRISCIVCYCVVRIPVFRCGFCVDSIFLCLCLMRRDSICAETQKQY